jgi:plasmid stabilization system protein ParE
VNFTIIWSEAAIQDLARIWLQVIDRNAITRASNDIDQLLSRNPQFVGESRIGNQRVTYADPLGVRFEVVLDDLRVTVGAVWLIRPT